MVGGSGVASAVDQRLTFIAIQLDPCEITLNRAGALP